MVAQLQARYGFADFAHVALRGGLRMGNVRLARQRVSKDMIKQIKRVLAGRGGQAVFAILVVGLLAGAALMARVQAPSSPGQTSVVGPDEASSLPASEPDQPAALDPAAQGEIDRLSRLPHAELMAAAQAKSGFSRLLALNVLWARGETATVDQIARTSGDRVLVAKARALASRNATTRGQ